MKNENLSYNDKLKVGSGLKLALKYQNTFFAFLAFLIPFITYIMTLQPKLVGGDTRLVLDSGTSDGDPGPLPDIQHLQ